MITGISAIFAYPMTSGIPSAASVTPATMFGVRFARSSGRIPWNSGSRCSVFFEDRAPLDSALSPELPPGSLLRDRSAELGRLFCVDPLGLVRQMILLGLW